MQLRVHFGDYAGGLEHALALATLAHATLRDKCGHVSSMHPVRMALALPDADPDMRTVALLRDVIEESELTLDDLRQEGFPEHIVQRVDALAHEPQFTVGSRNTQEWGARARQPLQETTRLARYQNALQILDSAGH